MEVLFKIFLVVVLVVLNGFFVCAEYAVVKLRSAQLNDLLDRGNPSAILAKSILERLDSFLSATQTGVTLASLALGWIGEPLTTRLLQPIFSILPISEPLTHTLSVVIGFLFLTAVHIIFGEQIPKALAINYELQVSLKVARPLTIYYKIFLPIIWGLNKLVGASLDLFGFPKASDDEGHTREELRSVILDSARRGIVETHESTIIESLFEFNETTAKEIMVHRSDVIGIDLDLEPREILHTIETEGFSRLPVFRDSLDDLVGVLHVKDLIPYFSQLERQSLPSQNQSSEFFATIARATRPPLFISETQSLSRLLYEFQKHRMLLGIVVSEHGGVEGIVTLEDTLEELVGEIRDESDVNEDPEYMDRGESIYVDPSMHVEDFNERFHDRLPTMKEGPDYQTISGYIQKAAGRVPNVGDVIEIDGVRFTILRKERHKLEQIKVEAVPTPAGSIQHLSE